MKNKSIALALTTTLLLVGTLLAAQPQHTLITVKEMHCAGCAKKIADQLYKLPGVKEVRVDLKTKALLVLPAKDTSLSPKTLWTAVEKEDVPVRLIGPHGTFTSKPKF